MRRSSLTQGTVLGIWFLMVWIDPMGTYQSAVMIGATLLPLLLITDTGRSPWDTWQGALPIGRRAWLAREMALAALEQALLQGAFWVLVALVKAGAGGWGAYLTGNLGTMLTGLAVAPWLVTQGLDPGEGPWNAFRPWRLGPAFSVILAIAALGALWEHAPGIPALGAVAAVLTAGAAGAWFRARHLLFRRTET